MPARIIGTGSALPQKAFGNKELEKLVDTTDEWIKSRTGIENRYIAVEESTTSMAVEAAKRAMEEAGVGAEELDLIIVGTISGDMCFPSTACQVQSAISAANATAFDINAACAGFLFGLTIAEAYMKAGMAQTALVIGAETLSKMMDWNDRGTCVLFGDGAGAAIVKREETGIMGIVQGSDGARGSALVCKNRPLNNPFVHNGFSTEYTKMIKYFLLHQANIRIIESVAKKLNQPISKFPTNLQECGNISAGSVPILLDFVNKSGKFVRGDKIVLAGFGAGLTWGAAVLTW